MPVHHGRHEMPGWRGYLPESVDRAARARSGRRDRGLLGSPSRRVVAFGALAVCAVAGGAVITTRPAGPDALPGPADEAVSASAGSSAWTREATPVLTAIDTELERIDEVRQEWDTSPVARRDGPPPQAVLALLGRQKELAEHRDALRSAMASVRSESASGVALATAWQQLRAAQEMLRALDAGRSALGDPVEATVLRLALEKDAPAAGPGPDRETRGLTPRAFEDTATVALAATTSTLRDPSTGAITPVAGVPSVSGVAPERTAPTVTPTAAASDAVVRSAPSDGGTADGATETAGLAAPTDRGDPGDDGIPDSPTQDTPTPQGSSSLDPTPAAPSDQSMLTFDRSAPAAQDEESTEDEQSLEPDPAPEADPEAGEEATTSPE